MGLLIVPYFILMLPLGLPMYLIQKLVWIFEALV